MSCTSASAVLQSRSSLPGQCGRSFRRCCLKHHRLAEFLPQQTHDSRHILQGFLLLARCAGVLRFPIALQCGVAVLIPRLKVGELLQSRGLHADPAATLHTPTLGGCIAPFYSFAPTSWQPCGAAAQPTCCAYAARGSPRPACCSARTPSPPSPPSPSARSWCRT